MAYRARFGINNTFITRIIPTKSDVVYVYFKENIISIYNYKAAIIFT
ncbi:hypothetical protein SAMN05421857_2986 [Chryseobacterium formosense]|nr:hypothetical protein SAMN05421857_2986 [Chryseobacterium formosense]